MSDVVKIFEIRSEDKEIILLVRLDEYQKFPYDSYSTHNPSVFTSVHTNTHTLVN